MQEGKGNIERLSHRKPPLNIRCGILDSYEDVVKYFVNKDRNLDVLSILLTYRNSSSDNDFEDMTSICFHRNISKHLPCQSI